MAGVAGEEGEWWDLFGGGAADSTRAANDSSVFTITLPHLRHYKDTMLNRGLSICEIGTTTQFS